MADVLARGAARKLLLNNATFNVATTGSDATGNGTAASPWATIQFAVNQIAQNYDLGSGSFHVILQVGDGTYAGGILCPPYDGIDSGSVWGTDGNTLSVPGIEIRGNLTTPANVVIQVDGNATFNPLFPRGDSLVGGGIMAYGPGAVWGIRGVKFTKINGNVTSCICASAHSQMTFDQIEFAANANGYFLYANQHGLINDYQKWTISGAAATAIWLQICEYNIGANLTITGTPAFTAFIRTRKSSVVFFSPASVTGTCTGPKAICQFGGAITMFGTTVATMPGSTAPQIDYGAGSRITDVTNSLFFGSDQAFTVAQIQQLIWPEGTHLFATDLNSTTPGAAAAGGGANRGSVVYTGGSWKIQSVP